MKDTLLNEDAVYHYCHVQIPGISHCYAYLTGGLPLQLDDWVEVPFVTQAGQIKRLTSCTRSTAPWPPEKTKTVRRIIDAPPPIADDESEDMPTSESDAAPVMNAAAGAEPPRGQMPEEKRLPRKGIIAMLLVLLVLAGAVGAGLYRGNRQVQAYAAALDALSKSDYASAGQAFSALSGYRDSASLTVYCEYADFYQTRTYYGGGLDELSKIKLQYDTQWQKSVDALEMRVKIYKARKDAADKARRNKREALLDKQYEDSLKFLYSGKEPSDGMPMRALKYTTIGAPDEIEKCLSYEHMDVDRRYKKLVWYDDAGRPAASCYAHMPEGETHEVIYSFSYIASVTADTPAAPRATPWNDEELSRSYSSDLREEYDSPEDFWEENKDLYADEDDAWDEWYDEWQDD